MADQTVRSLQGVRVLALPDPKLALCCKLLAEHGADVVAVELPEGSALRSAPPLAGGDGESLLFWYGYSRARSVECDLASAEGRDRFVALAVKADVLLDALPPGRLEALGVAPEVLAAANPGLIHLSATDFGSDGPFRDFEGSDIVAWAMGGLMGLTGDPAREPLTAPALQAYHCTSVWAAISVLGAVYRRRKTGQGARIDLSSQETSFDMFLQRRNRQAHQRRPPPRHAVQGLPGQGRPRLRGAVLAAAMAGDDRVDEARGVRPRPARR